MQASAISVIILSYNTLDITKTCLGKLKIAIKHFEKTTKKKVETIVVDNASIDSSAQALSKYKWLTLIKSTENLGFARANNLAMRQAKGDYFLLLNSDVFVTKDTLVKAYDYVLNKKTDVLGCKLAYKDSRLQPSAGFIPSPTNILFWMFGIDKLPIVKDIVKPFHPNHESFFDKDRKVGWIMGAFMFLRREVFLRTGGFDDNYFMYTEEVEWCKRIADTGFKIVYTPSFSIVHLGAASSNFDNAQSVTKEFDGVVYFFKKHFPGFILWAKLLIFLGSFIRIIKSPVYARVMFDIWKK